MADNTDIAAQIAAAEADRTAAQTSQSEAQKRLNVATLEGIRQAKAVLNTGKLATLEADLEPLLLVMERTSICHHDIRNVIAMFTAVRENHDREIARLERATADDTGTTIGTPAPT